MGKRKQINCFIRMFISLIIIALHFIPWMKYRYALPGLDEYGNEIILNFVEWWSPFYQASIQNEFQMPLCIISFSLSIISFLISIYCLIRKKQERIAKIVFTISVVFFILLLVILFLVRPCR